MLERLTIRNFKCFRDVRIELGRMAVFVGPTNAGKTSALQALALWSLCVNRWHERKGGKAPPQIRSGVTINRQDLVLLPVPDVSLLWHDTHAYKLDRTADKPTTRPIRIEIEVEGVEGAERWSCGVELDYASSESMYCRPLGWAAGDTEEQDPIPPQALNVDVAFLPPISSLVTRETRLDPGAINVLLGQGRTGMVLRNLCYQLHPAEGPTPEWSALVGRINALFGVTLGAPEYHPERGELTMTYRDVGGTRLDLTASGRGLQQTLLLLAHVYGNPGAVLLLDEPDAHLEILRQRQVYRMLAEVARERGCQIVAASHSDVFLSEAADEDLVVAFVGEPHRIDDRGAKLLQSLESLGHEQFRRAAETGWVLYLQSPSDLAVLKAFAETLGHPAAGILEKAFVSFAADVPGEARAHFDGLREAKRDLVGLLLTDPQPEPPRDAAGLREARWERPCIESYFCSPEVLAAFAESLANEQSVGPLFLRSEHARFRSEMQKAVERVVPAGPLGDPTHRWWRQVRADDELLSPALDAFFAAIGRPNPMTRSDAHRLARLVPKARIDDEVKDKLDLIVEVAKSAVPESDEA